MKKVIVTIIVFLVILITGEIHSQPVWNIQNSGTSSNLNRIIYITAINSQKLFIAGDNGTILSSSNLGLVWETISSNTNSDLYSIDITNFDLGYAAGAKGTILRTTDSGNSWISMISNTIKTLREIRLVNGTIEAIAVGDDGAFLKLENNVWTFSQIDTTDLNSFSYDPFNSDRLIVVGNYGTILRSTNAGMNWTRLNSNTASNLNHISYFQVIGNNGTALQINVTNIFHFNSGTSNNLYGLYNLNSSNPILACGANGTLVKNWQPVNTNSNQRLNSVVQNFNIDNCFAIGENGLILFTNTLNLTPNAKQLNSNNISAWYMNNGIYNHNPLSSSGFEWPKGSNKFARYTSGSVIGSIVNGDTLVTVCHYGSEYLPGYTDQNGNPHGNGEADYKVYKIIFDENDPDRMNWPSVLLGNSDQGAPVYYDQSSMQWKPVDYGNQTMFYSYTDSYPESHTYYSGMTSPLKADIKQINWSFNQPEELKNIIYQEFRIINRNNSAWTNAYINISSDDDLGTPTDDRGGVDTNLSLTYMYNSSNEDGIYGMAPPAVGFAVIRSPLIHTGNISDTVFYCEGKRKKLKIGYKEIRLGSSVMIREDSQEPGNYVQNYNVIRGLNKFGNTFINPITNLTTKFVYSGDPVTNTGWNYQGATNNKYYFGFGPLNMNPGDTQIIVVAQVIARGSSNLNSITKLRETAQTALEYYNNCFSNVVIGINEISSSISEDFALYQNYPNPFNPSTHLEFGISKLEFVTLKVYDALGKEVATLVNSKLNPAKYRFEFDGSNLSSGIYFYKLEAGDFVSAKKMLLLK